MEHGLDLSAEGGWSAPQCTDSLLGVKAMKSRERVLTTFAHREPDRVPRWCGASSEFWDKAKKTLQLDDEGLRVRLGDDFRRVYAKYAGPELSPTHKGASYRTAFGIDRHGLGYGQPFEHPLTNATIAQVHDYAWPRPEWTDASGIPAATEKWGREYAILGGEWAPFFHDAIDLAGMDTLFMRMHDEPQWVDALFQHIVDYYVAANQRVFDVAAGHIDIFFIGNDFGSQAGPLMSPALFDRFLLPHLQRLIDLGHAYGLKAQLHCCGGIAPLIPSLVRVGLDALHALQPSCQGMDLSRIKADFGDRIVLNGGIDSHRVLLDGTPSSTKAETRRVLEIMMPGGGYVAGASHDAILEEAPLENVLAMFDAIEEYGRYD